MDGRKIPEASGWLMHTQSNAVILPQEQAQQ